MIIGIDPGLNGSGFAMYDLSDKKFVALEKLQIWEIFDYMRENPDDFYLIENSNLDKRNWHGKTARGGVGKNKAVSQLIVDYAKELNLHYKELLPNGYSKQYTDSKGKFTNVHQKIFIKDTGWGKTSNKDSRAACAMILNNMTTIKNTL